nr:hypothetical protein [Tanacetum cinerariifolium]
MRRVGKGFSGVETPLFEGMLAARQLAEEGLEEERVQVDDAVVAAVQENVAEDVTYDAIPSPPSHDILSPSQEHSSPPQQPQSLLQAPPRAAQKLEIIKLKARVKRLEKANKDANIAETKGRHAAEQAEKQTEIYHLDLDHSSKVLSMQEDDSEVQEVLEVVTIAKLITDVVTVLLKRKGVIIRYREEELSSKTSAETPKLKDKGKGILIETSKPIKKKDQIELDAEYARKLHEEI